MKTLFIETQKKINLADLEINITQLPKKLAIAYSIQYKELAEQVKKKLTKTKVITSFVQVLGCSKPRFPKTEAVLLIGSGKFHAVSLALETGLPIYILEGNRINSIDKSEIDKIKQTQKAAYIKFLDSKQIGILVSVKPGQENLAKAIKLKGQLKNKNSYLFLANNINTNEFENFDIQSWVNTACSRLDMNNSAIININQIR